jgi:hypothetical protein
MEALIRECHDNLLEAAGEGRPNGTKPSGRIWPSEIRNQGLRPQRRERSRPYSLTATLGHRSKSRCPARSAV